MAAPGVDISSTCDTVGTVVGPCPPGENTTASGTSMASPHVAGAAAVLLQANPDLTPEQLLGAMQVTAQPVEGTDGGPAPFWEVGYGRVDLARAVSLVQSKSGMRKLPRTQDQLDRDLRAAEAVVQSDFWTYAAPTVAVNTDAHSYTITPDPAADQIRATIVHPSEATVGVDLGLFEYSVTIRDAEGHVLATQEHVGIGAEAATADLTGLTATQRQSITIDILGVRSVSDPDTLDSDSILNDTVTLQVVQRDIT